MSRTSQGAVLNMSKMREILRLHELSYSQCEIAHLRRAVAKGPAIPNSTIPLEKTSHGRPHLGLKPQAHSENPLKRVEPIVDYVDYAVCNRL
jgi:hypothetical protein